MGSTDHHINAIRIVRELAPVIGLELPSALWRDFAIDPEHEDAAFNMHEQIRFHRALTALMDDPMLGLRMSVLFPAQAYGMIGYAIMSAGSVREGLRLADKYSQLTYTLQSLSFIETDEHGELRFTMTGLNLEPELKIFFADRDLGSTTAGTGISGEENAPPMKVCFEHGDQGRPGAYERFFRCPVEFNGKTNSIFYDNLFLDRPNPYRNSLAHEQCLHECDRQLRGLVGGSDFVAQVRETLFQRPGYLQDIGSISRQFNMSARTLRRRLEEQGVSFLELQQDVRFQQAREHLTNKRLSISQISDILGYGDPANFSSAFKRWTGGTSPRAFRNQS